MTADPEVLLVRFEDLFDEAKQREWMDAIFQHLLANDEDDSGSLKHISIRHAGAGIASGNGVAGFTLAGVSLLGIIII